MNLKRLFFRRRWMVWLPLPASLWLVAPEWQHIPAMLFGGLIVWIPFWLAWWLSDGFRTVRLGAHGGQSPINGTPRAEDVYWNFAEGHYQNYQGPSSYRL